MPNWRKGLNTRGNGGSGMSFTYNHKKFILSKYMPEKQIREKSVQDEVRRHFIVS
jgi:hypothetical protein